MTASDNYGISPEVLAAAAAADRQNRLINAAAAAGDRENRRIADVMAAADRQNRLIANIRPVMSIIERQHNAMEAMRSSFEFAMRVQPPATRQALADMVHRLREDPPTGAALAAQARAAEPAILALVGQELAPEQVDEVQRGAEEVEADPELDEKLRRLVDRVDWSGVGTLTPWAALCVAAVLLFKVADLPVTEQLSTAQNAALTNWLMALGIIVALAAIIITIQNK